MGGVLSFFKDIASDVGQTGTNFFDAINEMSQTAKKAARTGGEVVEEVESKVEPVGEAIAYGIESFATLPAKFIESMEFLVIGALVVGGLIGISYVITALK